MCVMVSSRSVRPGWPETKTSSPSPAPLGLQAEVVLDLRGLVVLVDAEEADVEVVAGELEIVRVAAEEGDRLLRREDQPDVGVLLEAVEMVEPAVIERDHVAAEPGGVERFLLDGVHRGPAGLLRLGRTHLRLDRRIDSLGHVLDALQDVQLQVHAADLLLAASWRGSPVSIRSRSFVLSFWRQSAPTW